MCRNTSAWRAAFGAIKRAVLQGAIKSTDAGKTDKVHIVPYAHFLAARFFEASKAVAHDPAWAKGCILKFARSLTGFKYGEMGGF